VTTVYRDRAKAEEECARRNRSAVRQWDSHDAFEAGDRTFPGRSPFDPPPEPVNPPEYGDVLYTAAEIPFWEVVEIELEGL
jgi:hypothetical protein